MLKPNQPWLAVFVVSLVLIACARGREQADLTMPSSTSTAAPNPAVFTGTFVAETKLEGADGLDAAELPTTRALYYLSLTQAGNAISGYLTIATPNGRGSTQSQTISVQGNADGGAVTLVASFRENVSITGHRIGSDDPEKYKISLSS